MKYELNKPHPKHSNGEGYITEDGHTMFNKDVVKELNRLKSVEDKYEELEKKVWDLTTNEESDTTTFGELVLDHFDAWQ